MVARPANNSKCSQAATQGRAYEAWIFSRLVTLGRNWCGWFLLPRNRKTWPRIPGAA